MWWQRENSFHLRKVQVWNMTNPAGPWNSTFQTPALQVNKLLLVKSSNKKQVDQDPKSWARGHFKLIITYLDKWTYGSGFWKRNIFLILKIQSYFFNTVFERTTEKYIQRLNKWSCSREHHISAQNGGRQTASLGDKKEGVLWLRY